MTMIEYQTPAIIILLVSCCQILGRMRGWLQGSVAVIGVGPGYSYNPKQKFLKLIKVTILHNTKKLQTAKILY